MTKIVVITDYCVITIFFFIYHPPLVTEAATIGVP